MSAEQFSPADRLLIQERIDEAANDPTVRAAFDVGAKVLVEVVLTSGLTAVVPLTGYYKADTDE
jgi:hypothetical protein